MAVAVGLAACGGHGSSESTLRAIAEGRDFLAALPAQPIPTGVLEGQTVLVLRVGSVSLGDSTGRAGALAGERGLTQAADSALDTAVRAVSSVRWRGVADQEAVARRNPTLNLQPSALATVSMLSARPMERVPAELLTPLRLIAGMLDGRYAVVPPVVRFASAPGGYRASYLLVLVDTRSGAELWRARVDGDPRPTAREALSSAAGNAVGR